MFPTLPHTLLRLAVSDPAFRSGMADGLQKKEGAASRHVTFTESTRSRNDPRSRCFGDLEQSQGGMP
jgi:hypothetical protein